MNRIATMTTGILLCICCALLPAAGAEESGGAGAIESYQQAIAGAKDKKGEAVLRKKLGDAYAAQEDYPRAADEFLWALALAPSSFTRKERLQMAIAISWADRLPEAATVLRAILTEDPNDRDARIHLAKILSWSNKLQEAETEADQVLSRHPANQDALLVKANVLRWRGNATASLPFYEKALAQGENFDARIGLAYAYLDAGKKDTAKEISTPLKPLFPYQEKELARFSDALCSVQARHLSVPYSYYNDSDKNTVYRAALLYGFWVGRWDTELAYRLTDARDPVRHERAEDIGITARAKVGRFDTGAGMGISMTGGGSLVTGHAGADTDMAWGSIGASASREMLTDTAQLIENRITRTSGTFGLSETVSPRLSFFERFIYSGYSDGNNSEDLRLGAKYAFTLSSPKIAAGYRFRYLDFRRQSGSGYFDPEDFTSHQVYVLLYAEKDGYYANLEPSVGYQAYTRNGGRVSDTFYSLFAAAGWTMKKCTAFEVYVEGGNYAGGAVAGYNYYQVGFKLTAYFN